MRTPNNKKNIISIFIIFLLIMINLIGFFIFEGIINKSNTEASSVWTQSSESDFNNGTFNNVTLTNYNSDVELRLIDLELNEWTEKTPPNSPLERYNHALAPIWGTDKILLFGGVNGSNSIFNDTWIYDLSENKWTNKTLNINPGARSRHAMASIWCTDKVVLMGGGKKISNPLNDTWIYDFSNNTWTDVTTMNNPGEISLHKMASIYGEKKLVLFGGNKGSGNETWEYNLENNTWTRKKPTNNPPGGVKHGMASIWGTDKVLVFGGDAGSMSSFNESWVYDLSDNNWTQMAYGPPGRSHHDISAIYGRDKVLLFGGFNWSDGDINDTWIFDFSENTWTQIFPKIDPGKSLHHLMSSVWGTDKIVLFSGELGGGPLVNETWIFNPFKYIDKGTFTSSPYEIGPNSSLKTIFWEANVLVNTSIKFQLRSAETEAGLNPEDFLGPDGSKTSYYTSTPTDIWSGHNSDKWIQYKAYLSTTNYEETPRLKNVTITYNYWPNTTLIKPDNECIINYNCPVFAWNFTDRDSMNQSAFRVIIDDYINFESVDYDSNEQSSSNRSWQFPNGTAYTGIADGIWYWKVKTKDNDGDWGHYSIPWKIIIDTCIPNSIITNPVNKFLNNLDMISGIASDSLDGTGLNNVKIAIKRLTDDSYWTGQKWIDSESWIITSGTTNWTYDTSSVIWYSGFKYNIQSRAFDNAANIEVPKPGKIITMDFDNVTFSNAIPSFTDVSSTEDVEVGITISDQISGVNASTIEYKTSKDEGKTWTSWEPITGLESGRSVNITLNLSFFNGTGNRIKWRASDIAGNGPKESMTYSIKVDTSQLIPNVRLLSPKNNSIIPITSVDLSWVLLNQNLKNIKYNVFLDTVNPPVERIGSGVTNSTLIVNNLSHQETYYWTVIPRRGTINGTCESGVWSFTVDIPIPRVKLLTPENGSIINSVKPTLSWSVDYNGTEILKYDVYLDTRMDPGMEDKDYSSKYYLPKKLLENGKTYYWKVVPWVGDVKGLESEIWSFTVEIDEIPRFDLELQLEPSVIELEPGSIKYVIANVTNLGDITDSISVKVITPQNVRLGAFVGEPNTRDIISGDNAEFNITIVALENAKKAEIIIDVVATSNKALEYDLVLEKQEELTVKIVGEEKPESEKASYLFVFLNILILIIIIIIILAIAIYIHKRKKKEEEEEQAKSAPEAVMVKPGELPTEEISIGSAPKPEQLPKTTEAEKVTPVISPETPTPQLPGTTPEHEEHGAQQAPQLPPAETQESIKTSNFNSE